KRGCRAQYERRSQRDWNTVLIKEMVTIPLTPLSLQDNGFHLLVEIEVFGHVHQAVLDTGASKTVFDKTNIEKILDEGTELEYSEYLSTGLGTTSIERATLRWPLLRIGDW